MAKTSTSKRELIDTGRNKMFAKRDAKGQFKEMDDVGRSLVGSAAHSQDRSEVWARGPGRSAATGGEEAVAIPEADVQGDEITEGAVCPSCWGAACR